MNGRVWAQDDVQRLMELRARGANWSELGRIFGRTPRGVKEKHKENTSRVETEVDARTAAITASAKLLRALKTHHGCETTRPVHVERAIINAVPKPKAEPVEIELPEEVYNGVERIKRVVANFYKLRLNEIEAKRRTARIVRGRQVAMYLCKKLTNKSTLDIGRRFGGKDHTTVIHAERKIEDLIKTDPDLADEISKLAKRIVEVAPNETDSHSPDRLPPQADAPSRQDRRAAPIG